MADRYPAASSMLRCRIRTLFTHLTDMDNRIRINILDPRIGILRDSVDMERYFLFGYAQCLYDWEHIDAEERSGMKRDLMMTSLEKYLDVYRGEKEERLYWL